MSLELHRRTFDAIDHPKGSPERNRLNEDTLTSEYMPSYRYMLIDTEDPKRRRTYRSRREALAARELAGDRGALL